jgi:hypothetical protein
MKQFGVCNSKHYSNEKIYILLIAMFLVNGANGQSCLPERITFTTQTQIDSFQINYPNCTLLEGNVTISGDDITNLNGISVLTSIGGNLTIGSYYFANSDLVTLSGLEGLISVGGSLHVRGNDVLTSLNGLNNMISIGGGLVIDGNNGLNDQLSDLTGLNSLGSIGGGLYIGEYLSGGNHSLTSLNGLESLTSIGGALYIIGNHSLTNIAGLQNINAGSINGLSIARNMSLSNCEVQGICDYLANPHGYINVWGNATGCNSFAEVEAACAAVSVEDINNHNLVSIYPNPASDELTIESPATGVLSILNLNGQQLLIQEITGPKTQLDISNLPFGVYLVKLVGEKGVQVGKFVKQ